MQKLMPIRVGEGHFEIDLRGWMCPLPKYVFGALLPKLQEGVRMDLLVDCPGAITDIPKEASEEDLAARVVQIRSGEWKIELQFPLSVP